MPVQGQIQTCYDDPAHDNQVGTCIRDCNQNTTCTGQLTSYYTLNLGRGGPSDLTAGPARRLVALEGAMSEGGEVHPWPVSQRDVIDWRERSKLFAPAATFPHPAVILRTLLSWLACCRHWSSTARKRNGPDARKETRAMPPTPTLTAMPRIASREEWLAERKQLLAREKELTRQADRASAERRRLPMVKIEKDYVLDSPAGKVGLPNLFDGRRQLIVYHFMFDPEWDQGCPACTSFADALGDLTMLGERNTSFVLVSRAPLAKLEAYKARRGWTLPWVSSHGSDFNYDFHVTLDEAVTPVEYNFRDRAELARTHGEDHVPKGERHGLSVFFRVDEDVFHTYSAYARGTEGLTDAYRLLDTTPYGRQEDWEDSPPGWPQRPTYG